MPLNFEATAHRDEVSEPIASTRGGTSTSAATSATARAAPSYWDPVGVNPLRATAAVRELLRRPVLEPRNLVMATLVVDLAGPARSDGLPVFTIDDLAREAPELARLGIPAVKVFATSRRRTGVPEAR